MSDMPDTARLVSVPTAARIAGVNEKTVRRWIAAGRLAGIAGRRGWLVDADAVLVEASLSGTAGPMADIERAEPDVSDDARHEPDIVQDVPGIRELVELLRERDQAMREKDQTIMELSGRCGFLQARVQDLEREVRLLRAPQSNPLDSPDLTNWPNPADQAPPETTNPNHPAPSANGQDSGAECPPRRPWWQFWRWLEA